MAARFLAAVFAFSFLAAPAWSQDGDNSGDNSGDTVSIETRQELEQKIGADLSDVRLHTDANAQTISDQVNARAYTSDNQVHLGRNEGSSNDGRRLLSHELTHVVQQQDVPQSSTASENEESEEAESKPGSEEDDERQRRIDPDRRPQRRY